MRCLKPGFLSSHGIRGRSETRFDCCVSRPDPHVVTVYAQPLFGRLAGSSGYNASMGGFFALIVFTSPLFLCFVCLSAPRGFQLSCTRTCWGLLRPVPAFGGPLPRHSPSSFVVKTIYTYVNFTSIKISYMYILNQKIPPTP